ncbi:helix-turn-helix domain-containing protein [Dongia sedimenti]|uniref:Helix-turn-helix transcriptional regulator n=1 Tax=Dongia sedimenti TaxID=3064282 RepID=A0ABU0YTZ2_9PROT|nr:helix-turn-helix transcriptional regulator [Rhodospirillaceae bacterium R-7]
MDQRIDLKPRRFERPETWTVELLPRTGYEAQYTPAAPVIGFAFESQTGLHAFGTDRRSFYRARPNGLAFVPAGCDVFSSSERGGEYLKITLGPKMQAPWTWARRFSDAVDPAAIAAATDLRRLLLARDAIDPLDCERLVLALEARAAARLLMEPGRAEAWMTPQRLRRIDELIEARLEAKLTVQELAEALGLSAGFFARAFKRATGRAPHDYIIDRRIARARLLLRDRTLGLAAVALASGFASHAHMTATFRTRLGISPRSLR